MIQLCKSIGYWCLLITCLVIGVLLIGSFLLLWSMQKNFAFSTENVVGLATGAFFLGMFFFYLENRIYFPLNRPGNKKEKIAPGKIADDFYPKKFHLNTNLHGLPVFDACGVPSSIYLTATQINPKSSSQEKDYEKIFHDSSSGRIVDFDKTKPDHRELNEHFLWMIESEKRTPLSPQPYMRRYKIIHPETYERLMKEQEQPSTSTE